MGKRVILIDPGHGAETPGKRSPDGTLREYEFNRSVAKLLLAKLIALGFDARLTVTNDVDMPLTQRTNQARDLKRQGYDVILVSIHANASGNAWSTAHGIETYTNDQAEKLSGIVQQRLIQETGLSNRGVKQADLHITRETARYGIPSVLVELGFMTNKEEAALLKATAYREKCATAIAKGLCEYTGVSFHESTDNSHTPVDKRCNIEINGKLLLVKGILEKGKSLLPVRAVAEAVGLGSVVGWCETNKTVMLNGNALTTLKLIDGTGYAWSKEVAESLGLKVEWVGSSDTVKLIKA